MRPCFGDNCCVRLPRSTAPQATEASARTAVDERFIQNLESIDPQAGGRIAAQASTEPSGMPVPRHHARGLPGAWTVPRSRKRERPRTSEDPFCGRYLKTSEGRFSWTFPASRAALTAFPPRARHSRLFPSGRNHAARGRFMVAMTLSSCATLDSKLET